MRQSVPVDVVGGDDRNYEAVLCWYSWWDCPRFGVALVDGVPHYFECRFSDALDDYQDEFHVWPIDATTLDRELALWDIFVEWRAAFDAGAAPGPLESNPAFLAENAALTAGPREHATKAAFAVPEWQLDSNRSFDGRVPAHRARWRKLPNRPMSVRRVALSNNEEDWWAECLVCGAWVSTGNATRRDAEIMFGRHFQNEHLRA
jgi:hypothetical protein